MLRCLLLLSALRSPLLVTFGQRSFDGRSSFEGQFRGPGPLRTAFRRQPSQRGLAVASSSCGSDVVIVLERGGQSEAAYLRRKLLAAQFPLKLSLAQDSHRLGFVSFSDHQDQRIHTLLTSPTDPEAVLDTILDLPYRPAAPFIESALSLAKTLLLGRRSGREAHVLVLTDGEEMTQDADRLGGAVTQEPDVHVYLVALAANRTALGGLASRDSNVIGGPGDLALANLLDRIGTCPVFAPKLSQGGALAFQGGRGYDSYGYGDRPVDPPIDPCPPAPACPPQNICPPQITCPRTPDCPPQPTQREPTTRRPTPRPTRPPTRPPTTKADRRCFLDIMFILDSSASVEEIFLREQQLAASLVDRLIIGDEAAQMAFLRYSSTEKAKLIFGFGELSDKEKLKRAILGVKFTGGTTDTSRALQLANEEFGRGARLGNAASIAILFSDGFSFEDPAPEAQRLRDQGVTVFAVGIIGEFGGRINTDELEAIAGDPERVYTDETFAQFQQKLLDITKDCEV